MASSDNRNSVIQLVIDWFKKPKDKTEHDYEAWRYMISCAARLIIEEFLDNDGKINPSNIDEYCRILLSYISFEYSESKDMLPLAYSLMTLLLAKREKEFKFKKKLLLKSLQFFWEEPKCSDFACFRYSWNADLSQLEHSLLKRIAVHENHSISSDKLGISVNTNGEDIIIEARGWLDARVVGASFTMINSFRIKNINHKDTDIMSASQLYGTTSTIKKIMPIYPRLWTNSYYRIGDKLQVRVLFGFKDRALVESIDPSYYHYIFVIKWPNNYDLKSVISNGDILYTTLTDNDGQMSLSIDECSLIESLSSLSITTDNPRSIENTEDIKDNSDRFALLRRDLYANHILSAPNQNENDDAYKTRKLRFYFLCIQGIIDVYLKVVRDLEERCKLLSLSYLIGSLLSDNRKNLSLAELALQCNIVMFFKKEKNYIIPDLSKKYAKELKSKLEIDHLLQKYNDGQMPIQNLTCDNKAKELANLLNDLYRIEQLNEERLRLPFLQKIAELLNVSEYVKKCYLLS